MNNHFHHEKKKVHAMSNTIDQTCLFITETISFQHFFREDHFFSITSLDWTIVTWTAVLDIQRNFSGTRKKYYA